MIVIYGETFITNACNVSVSFLLLPTSLMDFGQNQGIYWNSDTYLGVVEYIVFFKINYHKFQIFITLVTNQPISSHFWVMCEQRDV